jgi:hypothetical protein
VFQTCELDVRDCRRLRLSKSWWSRLKSHVGVETRGYRTEQVQIVAAGPFAYGRRGLVTVASILELHGRGRFSAGSCPTAPPSLLIVTAVMGLARFDTSFLPWLDSLIAVLYMPGMFVGLALGKGVHDPNWLATKICTGAFCFEPLERSRNEVG